MKPREKKPEIVYRIISRESGYAQGSYSRACCDEFDFNSIGEARNSNVYGMYDNSDKYKISKNEGLYKFNFDGWQIFNTFIKTSSLVITMNTINKNYCNRNGNPFYKSAKPAQPDKRQCGIIGQDAVATERVEYGSHGWRPAWLQRSVPQGGQVINGDESTMYLQVARIGQRRDSEDGQSQREQ